MLSLILVALIIVVMNIVSGIQGTARVVNYAGLVRGKTQRIVKLEITGTRSDDMINDIESFIGGLRSGNEELNLVCLDDEAFQNKMTELADYFEVLKNEICRVRELGTEQTDIIAISENFFGICDDATGLAEAYSQRKATSLSVTEKFITADIVLLMLLIGIEFIRAVRYAAQNRALKKKVYLDSATGLPNKNKCEEILDSTDIPDENTGVCSFDLNNLRRINNSMGHEAGDEYIRRFAVCLREAVPSEHFVGRSGGDEFIAVMHGLDEEAMQKLMTQIREHMAERSKDYPDTPLSYAVGFALASDNPGCLMRELFILADKNMYIDKNHVKREEAAAEKKQNLRLLKIVNRHGRNFSDCIYCDMKLDTYRTIRAEESFFLASDGSYSGAVEQIAEEQTYKNNRAAVREKLGIDSLNEELKSSDDTVELQYNGEEQGSYSRLTVIPVDRDENGRLHHIILAFQTILHGSSAEQNAKQQLTLYYEQLKQSILENDSYVDALLDMAGCIYTVNLTKDILEHSIIPGGRDENSIFCWDYPLSCSYNDYCSDYIKKVTKESLGSYRITGSSERLLRLFDSGERNIRVEYCLSEDDGSILWVQKTVLMTRTVVYDPETQSEVPTVNAMFCFRIHRSCMSVTSRNTQDFRRHLMKCQPQIRQRLSFSAE